MDVRRISRRDALIQSGGALAAIAFFQSPLFAWARPGETNVSFLDQPPAPPPPLAGLNQLDWETQTAPDSWITPNEKFFRVGHYGVPEVDLSKWKLDVGGFVANPRSTRNRAVCSGCVAQTVFALSSARTTYLVAIGFFLTKSRLPATTQQKYRDQGLSAPLLRITWPTLFARSSWGTGGKPTSASIFPAARSRMDPRSMRPRG